MKMDKPNTENIYVLNLINEFCKLYGCSWDELAGKSRKGALVECRQMCWHIMYHRCKFSYSLISRIFNRDHATVMYGIHKLEDLIAVDHAFKSYYDRISTILNTESNIVIERIVD